MKHLLNFLIIPVVFAMISCTTIRYVPIKGEDIIKTEYKEIVRDSIVYIPIERDSINNSLDAHRDTLSVLSNRYSTSRAEVKSGHLNHSLTTKSDDSLEVKVIYKDIIRTDSVFVNKVVVEEVDKPIRDNIFWYSIIGNIVFVFFLLLRIKKFITL